MARFVDEYEHRFSVTGASGAAAAFDQQGAAAGRASSRFAAMGTAAAGLGPQIEAAGDRALGAGQSWLAMAGRMEQANVAFTTLLGSEQAAASFLGELQQFAAVTPFEFTGVQANARQLLAYGFAAKDIIPMLRDIGDASAALGGSPEQLDRMVRALGQMQAKGRVSGEEVMQLAEAGIGAEKILRKAFNVPVGKNLASANISAEAGIGALLAAMREDYGGSMEAQSKTLIGAQSNLQDSLDMTKNALGEPLVGAYRDATRALTALMAKVKEFSPAAREAIAVTTLGGGALLKYGGAALTAYRDWSQYIGILKIAKSSKDALAVATKADTAAERTKAGVAKTEAGAIGQVERAAVKATRAKNSLAGAGAGMGAWMTGGLGFGGLMQASAGAALTGGLGAGAALTSGLSVAAAGVIGWEIGSVVSRYLDRATNYIERGADWLTPRARRVTEEAGRAITAQDVAAQRRKLRMGPSGDVVIPAGTFVSSRQLYDHSALR